MDLTSHAPPHHPLALPGGLDYVMLTLVKQGMMAPDVEKKWNARVNVWIRSPGLLFSSFVLIMLTMYAPLDSACRDPSLKGLAYFLAFLISFNGQYYMQIVSVNTARKVETYNS
jgi:hypothetical protein